MASSLQCHSASEAMFLSVPRRDFSGLLQRARAGARWLIQTPGLVEIDLNRAGYRTCRRLDYQYWTSVGLRLLCRPAGVTALVRKAFNVIVVHCSITPDFAALGKSEKP
jgi:hypothetical protein